MVRKVASNFDAGFKKGHFDVDFTTVDLGGDWEGLEERGLLVTQGGRLGWDGDVAGGDGVGTGSGRDLASVDQVTDLPEIAIGHDGVDVLLDQWQQLRQKSNFRQKVNLRV